MQPTAFFVQNPFRPDRSDYAGTLFVLDPGTSANGTVTVTAAVGDAGALTATLVVSPTPEGDPDAGANLFRTVLRCAECHGQTGGGSPPTPGPDGSTEYLLQGMSFPYPAPGLNDVSPEGGPPNVAADPAWNAALLGVAAQADIDNHGVALRVPMPDEVGKKNADGGTVSAQDFAHIYAFLKAQTQ
jgi:mono/diheme cytochrome c family protein